MDKLKIENWICPKMIPRQAESTLKRLSKGFPIIALTGPRQSGKTTLAKHVFPSKTYVSLENPEELEFAQRDPKLAQFNLILKLRHRQCLHNEI